MKKNAETVAASARVARCVLHIGTAKTGTSTIQHFLSANRDALAADGIVYPAFTGTDGGSQWDFLIAALDDPWELDVGPELNLHCATDVERFRTQLARNVSAELEEHPNAETLLISSEHFHIYFDSPEIIAALKVFLEKWTDSFQIIVYLRRQDRVAISRYSTAIKSGNPTPQVFHHPATAKYPFYYDYDRLYAMWADVFGADSVDVRLYAELQDGDLIADFCAATAIDPSGKARPGRINESLSQQGADFLREANRQMPRLVDGAPNLSRQALAEFVSEHCKGRFSIACRSDAETFYHRFSESNERLRQRVFAKRNRPLFDDDFSEYPPQISEAEPCYADAVGIAIAIWEYKTELRRPTFRNLKIAISHVLSKLMHGIRVPVWPRIRKVFRNDALNSLRVENDKQGQTDDAAPKPPNKD